MTAKELVAAALALPPEERVEVIEALEASLSEPLDAETLAELERRLEEHRRDPSAAVDADVVFAELRAKYASP